MNTESVINTICMWIVVAILILFSIASIYICVKMPAQCIAGVIGFYAWCAFKEQLNS